MSDSINALISGQRNASVIDSLANPPQINALGSITRASEAAKSVMGIRALQAHQAWNDALAAATDKTTGVIDYPAAFKAFSATPSATYGMQEAATGASGLQNDQVTRGHYHLGILQGLFGGIDENMPPAQLRTELNATLDRAQALGLSPTDIATDRARIPADDAALPGYVRQFRFALSNGAEQAGYGGGAGGMDAAFLNEFIDVPDPENPGQKMSIRRGDALGIPRSRAATPATAPPANAKASSTASPPASTAPPEPSTINPGYDQGFKPNSAPAAAPAPAAAVTSAPTAIPSSAFTPPASTGAPSASIAGPGLNITVPLSTSAAPAPGSIPAETRGLVIPPGATPPPPPSYGGPPASSGGAPGAAVTPPPAAPAPRGVPEANALSPPGALAALNPFRIGSAEAQTFRGPGPQVSKDIDAYNAAVPTIQPQKENIIAGEAALKALELANTGPGTAAMSLAKRFLIAQGWPGADAIDLNSETAREVLNKNLIRFAQGKGGNVSTDFARSINLEGNPSADTLLKGANQHILVQDVGLARQKLAQTLTAPTGGVGQTEFGNGFTDHIRNFSGKTDWHGFAWDIMAPEERRAYLEEISKDKRAMAVFEKSKQIAKANGLWTRAPDAPPPAARPAAPAVNLLTPPAP